MDEKILIKSENYNAIKILIAMLAAGVVLFMMLFSVTCNYEMGMHYRNNYLNVTNSSWWQESFSSPTDAFIQGAGADSFWIAIGLGLIVCVMGLVLYWWLKNCQMVVTNKRVYGVVAGGKRVDLPIDSVSAVATGFPKAIIVASSSGRMLFALVENRDDIHSAISNLLLERQQNKVSNTPVVNQVSPKDETEELKKYKELLDMGVITQEEFDAKKKQLLDL